MKQTAKRKLLIKKLIAKAKKDKLPCPEGLAYYVCNRIDNGGLGRYMPQNLEEQMRYQKEVWDEETAFLIIMHSARTSTAERWLKHVRSGGTTKHISRKKR